MVESKTTQDNLIEEYVQNLLDIVGEQLNQHRMEIETIDKLNHVTLRRQKEILSTLKPADEVEELKVQETDKTDEEKTQQIIETGLNEVEMSVD